MRLACAIVLFGGFGCVQSGIDRKEDLPTVDEHYFRCEVQPVIAATCAFMDCHGTEERRLPLYAEQRFRLGISWDDYETPLTPEELAANLRAVRGFIARDPSEPQLLSEKPLDTRAGGMFHRGRDLYGTDDVFLSTDETGYKALRQFIAGMTANADCVPREDVGL